jgi:hypothetical protein
MVWMQDLAAEEDAASRWTKAKRDTHDVARARTR